MRNLNSYHGDGNEFHCEQSGFGMGCFLIDLLGSLSSPVLTKLAS